MTPRYINTTTMVPSSNVIVILVISMYPVTVAVALASAQLLTTPYSDNNYFFTAFIWPVALLAVLIKATRTVFTTLSNA